MSNLKLIVAAISICAFGLLTACSDGFKAMSVGEDGRKTTPAEAEEPIEDLSVYEEAVSVFQDSKTNRQKDVSNSFGNSVEAISLYYIEKFDDEGITGHDLEVKMLIGCDLDERITVKKSVDMKALRRRERVSLGYDGPYEFFVKCTRTDCLEAVVTVRWTEIRTAEATSHFIFGYNDEQISGTFTSRVFQYDAKQDGGLEDFFTKPSVAEYQGWCTDANNERAAGVINRTDSDDGMEDIF